MMRTIATEQDSRQTSEPGIAAFLGALTIAIALMVIWAGLCAL
jgi:hypothetical protein